MPSAPACRWLLTPVGLLQKSHNRVSIDQRIRLYFRQGLTQAETALCLSVRENIQICSHHLRRRVARLKLCRRLYFSDAADSDLDGPNLCDHEPHTHFQSRDESLPDKLSRYNRKTSLVM